MLKSLKHAEISCRKYCSAQLNNLEQKTNRAFVGLPLNRKLRIDHSQFRQNLSFSRLVNLMVYFIYLFIKSGRLDRKCIVCGADSSELPAPGNHHDSLFLPYLVQLGQAIGLDIRVIATDEGYADAEQNQQIHKQCGVTVLSAPNKKVLLPEAVDPQTKGVYLDKWCDILMDSGCQV